MKTVIVITLLVLVFPFSSALAGEQCRPTLAAAHNGTGRILAPDVLVREVLLPDWRAKLNLEVKGWPSQGKAVLNNVVVAEDQKPQPLSEIALPTAKADRQEIDVGS